MTIDLKQTGLRVKMKRKKLKLTQEKLVEQINVSPHFIYEIEAGSKAMSIYTLAAIAQTLKTSADYLLFGNNMPDTESTENSEDSTHPAKPGMILESGSYVSSFDRLDLVVKQAPNHTRDKLADVISILIPMLK